MSSAAHPQFGRAMQVLEDAIAQRAFPGAAFAVLRAGQVTAGAVGRFTYDADSPEVAPDTIYDVASVSKAVATATMAMILYERGQVDVDARVAAIVPEFLAGRSDPQRKGVTVRMLLAHSSGLPAYVRLFEVARTPGELLMAACTTPLVADPGTRAQYSDIGYIVLGELLSQVAEEPLDSFCQREIFGPLGMTETGFCPGADLVRRIPPTEDDQTFRHKIVRGEVNDENAWVLGGVAGHAGVFSTAADLARFAQCLLSGGGPILRRETVALFTRREETPPGTPRTLGWDTPTPPSQSGRYLSSRSFGHLGFTGTSLWIDPERELAIILLTNRTWPDRNSQLIKEVRPAFHDAVVESLR